MTINIKTVFTVIFTFIVFRLLKSKIFYFVSFGAVVAPDLPEPSLPINDTFIMAFVILLVIVSLLLVGGWFLFKKITGKTYSKTETS